MPLIPLAPAVGLACPADTVGLACPVDTVMPLMPLMPLAPAVGVASETTLEVRDRDGNAVMN